MNVMSSDDVKFGLISKRLLFIFWWGLYPGRDFDTCLPPHVSKNLLGGSLENV